MSTAGIIKAKVTTHSEKKPCYGSEIIEFREDNATLTAYVDESCLGRNTQNPKQTIEQVKWLLVKEHKWDRLKQKYNALSHQKFFENLQNKLDDTEFTIIHGNHQKVNGSMLLKDGSVDNNTGVIYLLMPYVVYPETQRVKNLRVVYLSDPYIKYALFKFPDEGYLTKEKSEAKATYGQTVEVQVYTHLLPDFNNSNDEFHYTAELINKGEVVATAQGIIKGSKFDYNRIDNLRFTLDPEWQKNHSKKEEYEKFYVKVTDKKYKTYTYDSEKDKGLWASSKNGEWVYDMHYELHVPYDTFSEMMQRKEQEKNAMIQYIGDIEYTQKENDPCGYQRIKIKEKDGKEFYLFDEEVKHTSKMDETNNRYFDIIAGDTAKEVIITVEGLQQAQNHLCTGVLLPTGERHDSWEKLFLMDKVQPAQKDGAGGHATQQDPTDPGDTDVYASTSNEALKYIGKAQLLELGQNYFQEGENGIRLKLNYNYNKTYEKIWQKLLGYAVDTTYSVSNLNVKSIAWVARYIFLKEKYHQTYFVPISSCRYPNQVARIRVFPDFEWWINVKYEIEKNQAVWVRQSPNYKYRVFTTEDNQNQKNAGERRSTHNNNWSLKGKKYKLDFEAGYKVNGQEYPLIPGDGFPLLNAIRFILQAYEVVQALTFAEETQASEKEIAAGTAKTSEGREAEKKMTARWKQRKSKGLPFKIELSLPKFSGGVEGKFAFSKNQPNQIGAFYNMSFGAQPLFSLSGKVDLLFFAQFIGPIGQAMHRINQVVKKVNYLTLGAVRIDYFMYMGAKMNFNFEVNALEYHTIDGWGAGNAKCDIPIDFYLESGVNLEVSIQSIGSAEAEAKVKGTAKFMVYSSLNKRTGKDNSYFHFNGLEAKIWLNFKANSRGKGNPNEPEETPDYIVPILKGKDPWKINIL